MPPRYVKIIQKQKPHERDTRTHRHARMERAKILSDRVAASIRLVQQV